MNQYGPAIVLGGLIGAAILLDDVITPSAPTRLMRIEARELSTLHAEPHAKISIQKSKANAAAASKDVEIVVVSDQAPVVEGRHVGVDVDGLETAEIVDVVRAVVDKAREDGTLLSPDALKAAVMTSLTDSEANSTIEIKIEVDQAPHP
mgnify:CR=1 FL=1